MSYILTYVRVVLTSDEQSILEIPATDEIPMEDRNQTCVSTATFESCWYCNDQRKNKSIHQARET